MQHSSAEQIAEVVYEAATGDTDQLRHVAGDDANALYTQRLEQGAESFRKWIGETFMGLKD